MNRWKCIIDKDARSNSYLEAFATIMQVTIKDVARESGVNISTVSRALNNSYGVNEQTREHVSAVAARLNYRPNRVARGLVTGRSHSLGLILSDIRNPFFAEVARGAEDAARTGDCDLVLCNSDLDADKQAFLGEVWEAYGQFSAWKLRQMSHLTDPWKTAYAKMPGSVISNDSMRFFFKDYVD